MSGESLAVKLECKLHLASLCKHPLNFIAKVLHLVTNLQPLKCLIYIFQNEWLIQCYPHLSWQVFMTCFVTKDMTISINITSG